MDINGSILERARTGDGCDVRFCANAKILIPISLRRWYSDAVAFQKPLIYLRIMAAYALLRSTKTMASPADIFKDDAYGRLRVA
jgi:hypothetical protein